MTLDGPDLHDDAGSVHVTHGEQLLLSYVYRSDISRRSSPRPFFHPIHTLGGELVTAVQPADHPWHLGLSWSLPNVGSHNFWGGPTFVRGAGYQDLDNNGSMEPEGELRLKSGGAPAEVAHDLVWRGQGRTADVPGAPLVLEQRSFAVRLGVSDDAYLLSFESVMTNISEADLPLGSPTTKGRPNAGYGGLFWRGPESFVNGKALSPGREGGDDLRGAVAPWMGYTGGEPRPATVVIVEDPRNPDHPHQWFVRTESFAGLNPAPFFSQEMTFPAGATRTFRYAVVIADGPGSPQRAQELVERARAVDG